MRGWSLLALLGLTVSGCFGGGGGGGGADEADDDADPMDNTTLPPAPEIVYTNRIWFGEAPAMSAVAPALAEAARTPMDSNNFGGGGGGGGPVSVWTYDFAGNGTITGGTLHVWVEVVDQLLNPPNPFDQFRGGACTWQADVIFEDSSGEASLDQEFCIADSGATIAPGEVELEFELDFSTNLALDGTLIVELSRSPFSASPDNSVFVLSGTPEYDTWVEFVGLMEPVP